MKSISVIPSCKICVFLSFSKMELCFLNYINRKVLLSILPFDVKYESF